jgi:hypothetical protein
VISARFSIVALLLLGCSCQAQDDARVLYAIGQVEGRNRLQRGDNLKAFGLYQLHAGTWDTANAQLRREGRRTYPLSAWKSAEAQDMVAAALLRSLRAQLKTEGIHFPTPEQLALCWNMGFAGARSVGFNPHNAPAVRLSYAQRVGNLTRAR